MPAESKSQQRLMGMAHAYEKGELDIQSLPTSLQLKIKSLSKNMKSVDIKDYAETKHKNLPEKKGSLKMKYFEKISYDVKEMTKKELKNNLKESPGNAMAGGAVAGLGYALLRQKPKLRYSMVGGAMTGGTLDAIQKHLSYKELKRRDKKMTKKAGLPSEVAGSMLLSPGIPIGAAVGLVSGPKTKKEMKKQDKKMLSNFIPFVAPYRLGRRLRSQVEDSKTKK